MTESNVSRRRLVDRPFPNLRGLLTFFYSILLVTVVLLISVMDSQHPILSDVVIAGVVISVVSIALIFVMTHLLLRPLVRLANVAQAIASGDLEQHGRLLQHLPRQDEIDRLAGSLSAMVKRIEHAEEMQLAAEQRFRRFFSDASHQLRTPLTSIRGFTEVLMRGAKDDPEIVMRVLKLMKSEGERMTALINDLLTLARLDDSRSMRTQYVDLIELSTASIEKMRLRVQDGRTVSLSLLTQERLGVQADAERLKQLLFVLLDNALKYGRSGSDGMITLQLDKQNRHAVIRVVDNGEGIAEDDLKHIFDSFYRGHHRQLPHSNGTSTPGTGLGLTIAVAVVHAHHGTMSVYSEPDKGTTFMVSLPCVD